MMGKKVEEILSTTKLNELLKKEEKKECGRKALWTVLAVVGGVAVLAGIAYAVYRIFFAEDGLEDFDDEYYDDFDFIDDEDDDDDPVVEVTVEEDASGEESPAEDASVTE